MKSGIDLLTFPSHTTHALQPLNVSYFKPFKVAFRAFRDRWTLSHVGKVLGKADLAAWVSWALKKALTKENITSGFRATGIYPLNITAVNKKFGPSLNFDQGDATAVDESASCSFSKAAFLQELQMEEIYEDNSNMPECKQYFVNIDNEEGTTNDSSTSDSEHEDAVEEDRQRNFFELPKVPLPKVKRTGKNGEPYVDYSKSI